MFEYLDAIVAEMLGVDEAEFVYKIERTTEWRREVIINAVLSDDAELIIKAKQCFKLIK